MSSESIVSPRSNSSPTPVISLTHHLNKSKNHTQIKILPDHTQLCTKAPAVFLDAYFQSFTKAQVSITALSKWCSYHPTNHSNPIREARPEQHVNVLGAGGPIDVCVRVCVCGDRMMYTAGHLAVSGETRVCSKVFSGDVT